MHVLCFVVALRYFIVPNKLVEMAEEKLQVNSRCVAHIRTHAHIHTNTCAHSYAHSNARTHTFTHK